MSKLKRVATIGAAAGLGFLVGGPTGAYIGGTAAYAGTQKSPKVKDEPPLPLPDEEAILLDRKKRNARRIGGRSSTILSGDDSGRDTFG